MDTNQQKTHTSSADKYIYPPIEVNLQNREPNLLFLSSFIFITNVFSALFNELYLYSFLFLLLAITSLNYHSNNTIFANIIDKIAITMIVIYGAYTLYNKRDENKIIICLIVLTFLLCIYMYIYGYFTETYCFYPDKCLGNYYHVLLHLIGSFGHHLIIFL